MSDESIHYVSIPAKTAQLCLKGDMIPRIHSIDAVCPLQQNTVWHQGSRNLSDKGSMRAGHSPLGKPGKLLSR